jgi:hypothetical protein
MIVESKRIPKVNQLKVTKPNHDQGYLKVILNCINFFRDGDTHRIKKNVIVIDYRFGGLK